MYYSDKEHCANVMQSLGIRLRLERERRKIGISKIADDTCIAKRYLEAIEADDQTALPGEFFYRAFVRQYSTYLGWDPDETEKQINLVSLSPTFDSTTAAAATPVTTLDLVQEKHITALRETLKDKPMRAAQDPGMSQWWLGFAALVIVGCATYFGWRNFSPAAGTEATAPVAKTVAPPPAPVVVPVAAPVTTPAQTQEATPPAGGIETKAAGTATEKVVEKVPEAAKTVSPTDGQFTLTVRAKSTTWIRITADGVKVYGGTIDGGQEKTLNARNVELIVGNAGTLDVIYKGKQLSVGSMGEVKTLLMNAEGWKYKPKPVADPAASTPGNRPTGSPSPGTIQ